MRCVGIVVIIALIKTSLLAKESSPYFQPLSFFEILLNKNLNVTIFDLPYSIGIPKYLLGLASIGKPRVTPTEFLVLFNTFLLNKIEDFW